ncbi:MAG: acyltransferase [Clostridia bacterium]|nr:acyltransferase [Clostridia bacterium]
MKKNLLYLDGMRALMAINVILCHFVCVYFPEMYFPEKVGTLNFFATTPLNVLVNGNVAVVFFFALTGFLVGRSVFIKKNNDISIIDKLKTRYIRLLPLVIVATLFTFVTMQTGLQYHLSITSEYVNTSFLHSYCNFEPTLINLISHSIFWPFVDFSAYIGPFWTIKYELWGYIIVLIYATCLKKSRSREWIYLIVIVVMAICLDSYYCIFIMGLFVADLCFNTNPSFLKNVYQKLFNKKPLVFILFLISLYFSCCPMYEKSSLYCFWYKLPLLNHILLRGFGIALFLLVTNNSIIIQKILSVKPLVALGHISFETYALHWPIMLSLQAGLFLLFEKQMNYSSAALLPFIITLPVIYIVSFLTSFLLKQTNKLVKKCCTHTKKA